MSSCYLRFLGIAGAVGALAGVLFAQDSAMSLTGAEDVSANDVGAKASVVLYYEGAPFCGGVVFEDRFILTAAHCFTDQHGNLEKDPEDIQVRYWASGMRDVRKVEQFIVHENYLLQEARSYDGAQAWDYDNFPVNHEDIAVLKIAGTHPAGAVSALVPEINNEYSGKGESVWFFAYGASVNGKMGKLQRATIGSYSPLEQIIPGKRIEVLYFVRQMIVITSKFNEKVSQCHGDSGSGVFLAQSDDIPYDDEPEKLPDALRAATDEIKRLLDNR